MSDVDRKTPRQSAELARLPELTRLMDAREWDSPWRKWGPYLSERQWGTVREDYSQNGAAWEHFPHDHARSRAYHWGEDGLAGFSDLKQRLCFALTLWNGKDPILKERLFGLSNREGNHGEDVKEYYFYLDSTPTHSYMKWLVQVSAECLPVRRSRADECAALAPGPRVPSSSTPECSTKIATSMLSSSMPSRRRRNASFGSPSRIGAGRPRRSICCRPCGSATPGPGGPQPRKPHLKAATGSKGVSVVAASHPELGDRRLHCDGAPPLLFTENDTNTERLFGAPNAEPLRQGRLSRLRRAREHRRRQPGRCRYQGCRTLSSRGRCRPVGGGAVMPHRCPAGGTALRGFQENRRGKTS